MLISQQHNSLTPEILVPEALRFVGLPSGIAANVRQMLYGAALILVIWLQQAKGRGRLKPLQSALFYRYSR